MPLPASIASSPLSAFPAGTGASHIHYVRPGPFVCGSVLWCLISGRNAAINPDPGTLHAYKSTDGGNTWAASDDTNAARFWRRYAPYQTGSQLTIAHDRGSDTVPDPVGLSYSVFDMLSGEWIHKDPKGPTVDDLTKYWFTMSIRNDGSMILHYINDMVGDLNTKGEVEVFDNGSWISPSSSYTAATLDENFYVTSHLGTRNRTHLWLQGSGNLFQTTFKGDNTLGTKQDMGISPWGNPGLPLSYACGERLALPYIFSSSGDLRVFMAASADDPTWSDTVVGNTHSAISSADEMTVAMCAARYTLFLFWISDGRYIYFRMYDGTGWSDGGSSDTLVYDAGSTDAIHCISVNLISFTKVGIIFDASDPASSGPTNFTTYTLPSYTGDPPGGGTTGRKFNLVY